MDQNQDFRADDRSQALAQTQQSSWVNGNTSNFLPSARYFDGSASGYYSEAATYPTSGRLAYHEPDASLSPKEEAEPTESSRPFYASTIPSSSWSPLTPTGGDGIATYFNSPPSSVGYTGSTPVSPIAVNAVATTQWVNHMFPGASHSAFPGDIGCGAELRPSQLSQCSPALSARNQFPHDPTTPMGKKSDHISRLEGVEGRQGEKEQMEVSSLNSKKASYTTATGSSKSAHVQSPAKKHGKGKSACNNSSPGQETLPGSALRTAARKHRRLEAPHRDGETMEDHRARTSHNQVEKEYRNRLHKYFEQLLEVLPEDVVGASGGGEVSPSGGPPRRLSKAAVLDKACRRIRSLEEDTARLRREQLELKEEIDTLRMAAGDRE
ncbi:hypothetical protein B0T17DRAFT_253112 [Bombardia bombarda]|uniref:BHLH domain-containing protein n=1 Tax=Bombardia bombarda TaxID=252184 RepID=A0AA40C4I1_9PEZI|nr:hypothetical protein B0T17DRAFT_253112 [Bombardia bombarda]